MRSNNKHDSTDDNAFSSVGEAFHQDNSDLKIVAVAGGVSSHHMNDMVTDANGRMSLGNIEDCHLEELTIAEMVF